MGIGRSILPGCGALFFAEEINSIAASVSYVNDAHIKGWTLFGEELDATSHQQLNAAYTWNVNDLLKCKEVVEDELAVLPTGGLCFRKNCCGSFGVFTKAETSGTSVASVNYGSGAPVGDVCVVAPGHTVTGAVGMSVFITPAPGPPITPAGVYGVFLGISVNVLDNDFDDTGGFTCQYCGGIDRFTSSWFSPVFPYSPWPVIPYKSIFNTFNFSVIGHDDFDPPSANPPGGSDCGYDSTFIATVTVT
jgi:hypothetical protein